MPKGSPRSPNLLVIVLGLLIIGAFPTAFVSVPTVGAMLVAVGLYVLFFALVLWRVGHPLDVIWVSIAGGAPVGFLVLGLGGLVALELSRLAGSSLSAGVLFVLVGGATIGSYLAVGLTAMAAGGVRRPWLPMASMLLVPAIVIGGSFLIRNALAAGAAALNYALLQAIFIGFGAAAWPRVSARYASALEEVRRDEERKQEEQQEKTANPATDPHDPQRAAVEAQKAALKKQVAQELTGVGVALSGGGHRAALFDLGVLLYLVRAGKHSNVAQISSVSGGSMTNGYIARSVDFQKCTLDEFDRAVGRFARQLADRGTLFAYWQSIAYVVALVVTGAVSIVAFAFWIRYPPWLPETWLVPAAAISALVLLGYLFLQRGAVCRWAFRKSLFSNDTRALELSDLPVRPIHVFCATELQTGSGAYFFKAPFVVTRDAGPSIEFFPTIVSEGFQTTIKDIELATVVQASASLPGAFPPSELPVRGWSGITRRAVSRTWERFPAPSMLLVDGGVRDNLGVEWFLRPASAATTLLVVVNGAANKVPGRAARVSAPWLGDLRSLLLVKDLPYNTREQNRRQELLTRFLPSYRGQSGDITGVILHIEESPYDLAEALGRSATSDDFDSWLLTPEDIRAADALRQRPDFTAIQDRASAVRTLLEKAEDLNELREAKARSASSESAKTLARMAWASVLVPEEWGRRAHRNSTIPTTLSKLGRPAAAELMRHSFALAMAKLHILFNYPLCDVPSVEQLKRLMDTG